MSRKSQFFIDDFGRVCSTCNEYKLWDFFVLKKDRKTGHSSSCKECRRKKYYTPKERETKARIDENGRECNFCHEYKPYSEFSKKKNCPYGYYTICKKCNAIKRRLKKYNLTVEQYNKLVQSHGGKCAICSKEETRITSYSGDTQSLCIDHCHNTGKIRGLLCGSCNISIGKFDDSIELIHKAINYLENNLDRERSKRQVSINDRDCTLQYLYGITLQEYNEILESQNGGCAICGIVPDYGKDLGVDHDHETGKVRGLLCVNCNTAVGCFGDSKELMFQAIEYLS